MDNFKKQLGDAGSFLSRAVQVLPRFKRQLQVQYMFGTSWEVVCDWLRVHYELKIKKPLTHGQLEL